MCAGGGRQFYDNKKPLLTVRTQLVSTMVSRDRSLAAFFNSLREVTPNMDDSDLVQVRVASVHRSRHPATQN